MPSPPLHYEPEFERMLSPLLPRSAAGTPAAEDATNASVKRIARRFGFCPDYPLRTEVEAAIGMFRAVSGRERPNREDKIRRIDLMEREAARCTAGDDRHVALARLLLTNPADLPPAPQRVEHCFVRDGDTLVPVLPFEFTGEELASIMAAAQNARLRHADVKRRPGPNTGDLHVLLLAIRRIWTQGTGRPAVYNVDGIGRPSGPSVRFFVFIRWVMRATGAFTLARAAGERVGATSPLAIARTFQRLDRRVSEK